MEAVNLSSCLGATTTKLRHGSFSSSSSGPTSGWRPGSKSGSGSESGSSSITTLSPDPPVAEIPRRSLVPPKWEESVRVVSMDEYRAAALSLAHAFAADDYARYLVDPGDKVDGAAISPEDKWRLHVDMMTYAVAAHCLSGLVTTTGPDYDSVALWHPPNKALDSWLTTLRSGLWRLRFSLSAEGRARYFDEIEPLLRETKTAILGHRDSTAWYLVYLGTKPGSQRRGFARRLLDHIAEQADAQNRPIYLESSSEESNAFYLKYGFEIRRVVYLCRASENVKLSIMVREPNGVKAVPISVSMPIPAAVPVIGGVACMGVGIVKGVVKVKGKRQLKGKGGKGGVFRVRGRMG